MTFELFDESNAVLIHLSDREGKAAPSEWIIGQGTPAIARAVLSYARLHGIPGDRVQYSARPYVNPTPVE
jgi:hypothetical protein